MNVLDYIENELLTCLCSTLRTEGRPTCTCHHFGGDVPPVGDRCQANTAGENGQVWVRRASSAIEAEADEVTFGGWACSGSVWQSQIELGIYRCISAIPDENGNAPAPSAYDADRELLAADRATLAQVLCCWPLAGAPPARLPFELSIAVIGAQVLPLGPTGGCAGSVMTIVVNTGLVVEESAEPVFVSGPAGGA